MHPYGTDLHINCTENGYIVNTPGGPYVARNTEEALALLKDFLPVLVTPSQFHERRASERKSTRDDVEEGAAYDGIYAPKGMKCLY